MEKNNSYITAVTSNSRILYVESESKYGLDAACATLFSAPFKLPAIQWFGESIELYFFELPKSQLHFANSYWLAREVIGMPLDENDVYVKELGLKTYDLVSGRIYRQTVKHDAPGGAFTLNWSQLAQSADGLVAQLHECGHKVADTWRLKMNWHSGVDNFILEFFEP